MRNDELFSPGCPDDHARRLVLNYALRGLLDGRGCYTSVEFLAAQHRVYGEWLKAMRGARPHFECGFYEWLCRPGSDSAFVFRPGDLVKHGGRYCVVVRRCPGGVEWVDDWRVRCGAPTMETLPRPANMVELKDPDGHTCVVNAVAGSIEPADIPPEVFALAFRKAKDCLMLKGE